MKVTADQQKKIDDGEAGVCSACSRVIRINNPAGGDGTARQFAVHGPRSARCPGSRRDAASWEVGRTWRDVMMGAGRG